MYWKNEKANNVDEGDFLGRRQQEIAILLRLEEKRGPVSSVQ